MKLLLDKIYKWLLVLTIVAQMVPNMSVLHVHAEEEHVHEEVEVLQTKLNQENTNSLDVNEKNYLDDGVFRLLLIGNSFSQDASNSGQTQLLDILKAILPEGTKIEIGHYTSGGKTVAWYASRARNNEALCSLSMITSDTGKWKGVLGKSTISTVLEYKDWDVVTIQPHGTETTRGAFDNSNTEEYHADLDMLDLSVSMPYMLDYIHEYAPQSDVYYYLSWATSGAAKYDTNGSVYNTMLENVRKVQKYTGENKSISGVIPVGTAVQTARTSYLAYLQYNTDKGTSLAEDKNIGLTRDGWHVSYNIGRYIAALTFAETLIPESMRKDSYTLPSISDSQAIGKLPDEYTEIAQLCVEKAIESINYDADKQYAYTKLTEYQTDPAVAAVNAIAEAEFELAKVKDEADLISKLTSEIKEIVHDEAEVTVELKDEFDLTADTFDAVVSVRFGYTTKTVEITGSMKGSLKGKKLSILGASISTYAGTSNGAAADTTNSTIRNNAKYYPNTTIPEVTLTDTWWMQVTEDLGLELLVNNAWSGSAIFLNRSGTVGAYVDRCVQLHDDTGANAGEEPDIIGIQMGFNDFSYGKSTLGDANINYDALITENGYAEPKTTMEATAIMLDKMTKRYPDAEIYMFSHFKRLGQSASDTALMEELNESVKTVCAKFDVNVVDLYTVLDSEELIGDGKLHPNKLGMDAMSEAFKRDLIKNTDYIVDTHTVSLELDNVKADYINEKIVSDGNSFEVNLSFNVKDELTVEVMMGNEDITSSSYSDGKVFISEVTDDVTVTASAIHVPQTYRWQFEDNGLVSKENPLTMLAGTVTEGQFNKVIYGLNDSVVLKHDLPWMIEWKSTGSMQNISGNGARMFTSTKVNEEYNARYLFKSSVNGLIAMGEKTTTGSHNYGLELADYGIDATQEHVYVLENRINADGSNMIYLSVDGKEIGPMNHYYVGTTDMNTTSDWLSGKDFVFPYMGTDSHGLTNCSIDYIEVWENGKPEPMTMQYDDHLDMTGKTVKILDASDSVVTLEDNYLVATGIGDSKVSIDGTVYQITVEKAKINLVTIMGQSNAGNHFANATSDITCPLGTAYWWGSQGTSTVEPVAYTQPSKGFHTPLLAELYAQSVKADDPVKNVMIWHEGSTSKNGKSITAWASSKTNASGTAAAAEMIRECRAYYEAHSDKYEIVSNGVYWLQGESDLHMDPQKYTDCFMTMWNVLKDAGAEYMAVLRVRRSTVEQGTEHDDLDYSFSLSAQLNMINQNSDMFLATDITENWIGTETTVHSIDIRPYITLMDMYGNDGEYNDSYNNKATVKDGVLNTTMKTLYGSNNKCHYGKFGYGILGADAAYNMYHALNGDTWSIVQTDTSGHADRKSVSEADEIKTIDITKMTDHLTFRADVGSAAGTLSVIVKSGNKDVTDDVVIKTWDHVGAVDIAELKALQDVSIEVTYTSVDGTSGKVVYDIVYNTLSLKYDDHLDMTGKTVEILDAGTPTSYQVGYGVAEGTLDSEVVTLKDNTLIATGIGTAKVSIDDIIYEITVETAPISLILLAGQSNMQGSEGDPNQSIVCPDGMVYATYGDRYNMTEANASNYVPSALTGQYSMINANGTTNGLSDYPVDLHTDAGTGKAGPDSGFAYEWVKQTGEKVWVVNAAHGGTSINLWAKTGKEYKEAVKLFTAVEETLQKEIAAGHYTLSHMGYYWCQGCSDAGFTAEQYVTKYLAMHENFKADLGFDHDLNADTPERTFEFGGIIPVRAGNATSICYREGIYEYTTTAKYHESFKDLRMTGPRVAQYWMGNNPELSDIWLVCNIGEDWVTMPDGTNGVSAYFNAHYENGTVDYKPQVAQKASWYKPTTPAAVHDSIHYNQIGYNEVGRESVRNTMVYLGINEPENVETTVEFVSWDGFTLVDELKASKIGASQTLVVPMVSPVYKSKEVTYTLSEGLSYAYYDVLADSYLTSGTLSATNAKSNTVSVSGRELTSYQWELQNGTLVSTGENENKITRTSGNTENGLFIDTQYAFDKPFVLLPDQNWLLEWKMSGSWIDEQSTTSKKLFNEDGASATTGAMTILVSGKNKLLSIGYYGGTTHQSYGVNLAEHGIDVAQEHTYRLYNVINENQTNMIYLFVDGQQIAPMTRYITGSNGDTGTESNALSGREMSFGYMGTAKYALDQGIIDYVTVIESGASQDIHIHDYSQWIEVSAPTKDYPGVFEKTCASCNDVQTTEIDGVWQKYDWANHVNKLPENFCSKTNLWADQTYDDEFFYSGTHWEAHSSGTVTSITIPVHEGDQLYATSFGKAKENGHASSNGIRMTWFDDYGPIKTLAPADTYAEFSANGGYLVAPEGAKYANIPMWNKSNDNEVYILNAGHDYVNGVCAACGERLPGPVIIQQPSDIKAKLDENFCVTVIAEGEGLIYTWYGRDKGATSWFKSSITDNTYDSVMTSVRAGREVYCVITDKYGNSVTTDIAKILLTPTYIWEQWIQPVTMVAGTYPTYSGDGYRKEGDVFGGIIYSSTMREGTDAIWNFNHSTYYSAAANPASLLYTVNNAGRVSNEAAWMGSVCSTTALRACGYKYPYTTLEIPISPDFEEKTDHSINALEFGDILWVKGHVAGIIGVTKGDDGLVSSVKIIEQASVVRVFEISAANWDSYFREHWTTIYRGDFDESLTSAVEYPENYSLIFERGNNTYVTDTTKMLFYIPTASTVYLSKNGKTTEHTVTSFPSEIVNNTVVYDLSQLFEGVGDYYLHTEENVTDICIKVINPGTISINLEDGTATLSGYSDNCTPLGYRVIRIIDASTSKSYNFFHAPDGYTSEAVNLSFNWHNKDTFEIENIPEEAAGWKLEVYYDTAYGWARLLSENVMKHDHEYEAVVTLPTCTEAGYTTYTCVRCEESYVSDYVSTTNHNYSDWTIIKYPSSTENGEKVRTCSVCNHEEIERIVCEHDKTTSWDVDGDGVLEILAIGNSFSVDALEYAYQIAQDLGVENVVIGNLYIGGCSLETHANNARGDKSAYTYYFNDNGRWATKKNYKMSTALTERSWDCISMQQWSALSGVESSYNQDFTDLIAYVKDQISSDKNENKNLCTKLGWHMTWAYQQDSTHSSFVNYNKNQMTMYNAIVSAVQSKILTNEHIDFVVPSGTAVQNTRTSLLGDTLTRDGYHMSYDVGRYLTGLMFIKTVTGLSIDEIDYAPSGISAEEKEILIEAVNAAFKTPYEVTQSTHIQVMPDDSYLLLNFDIENCAYWQPQKENGYQSTIKDAANSDKFFATIRFTRDDLPVGSIILLESGWQYRPDGWVEDVVQTGTRENVTSKSYVLVTEEWWSDYTLRAFNVSKQTQASLKDMNEADLKDVLKIYVPSHTHRYESIITAPTCTEQGYTTHTCSVCGDSYVDSYVESVGHEYGQWVVSKNPTCDEAGLDVHRCIHCGVTESRTTYISGDDDKIQVSDKLAENYFEGKKIVTLGDSVTFGSYLDIRLTEAYPFVLGEILGATISNKAQSGTSLCTGGHVTVNSALTEKNIQGASVVTVMLGVNDFNHAVKDGMWSGKPGYYDLSANYYDLGSFDSTDTSTFYGALRNLCNKIMAFKEKDEFKDTQFVLITPTITSWNRSMTKEKIWNLDNENVFGHTLREYCNAIMEMGAFYNIPVFDANMFSGIYYEDEFNNNVDEMGGDGVHPSAAGHRLVAEALADFLISNYSYEERVVENNGHTYKSEVVDTTCEAEGYTILHCTECHYQYVTNVVEALGHKEIIDAAVDATCTQTGLTEGKHCERCGEVLVAQTVTDKLGHDYTTVVTAPTCEDAGYTTYTCTRGDHSYVSEHVEALGHEEVTDAAVDATCTETGLTEGKHCERCGEVLVEQTVTDKLGHDYESVITEPTCTTGGFTTHTCERCDDIYTDAVTDKLGHNYTTVVTAPTCETAGYTTYTCTRGDHTYVGDHTNALGHEEVIDAAVDATCTETGLTEGKHCERCGEVLVAQTVTDKLGHNYTTVVTAPTCEDDGYTTYTCVRCDDSYVDDYTNALGHNYGIVVTAPNCISQGYTTYTCVQCSYAYQDHFTAPTGEHDYVSGTCAGCGHSVLGKDWIAPEFIEGDYSMVVIPDPQRLVHYHPESYYDMMQWIADNEDTLNIEAVLNMGDMTDTGAAEQWVVSKKGMDLLNSTDIAWMPMMGNHDDSAGFNKTYDYATYGSNRSWFGGSYHANKLDHTYWFVDAGERDYLIFSLGWMPTVSVLSWAEGIIQQHPDKNVIITAHAYLNSDGRLLSKADFGIGGLFPQIPDGIQIWDTFKKYENVVLALSGHVHSEDIVTYVDQNAAGKDVYSMLLDRQNDDTEQKLGTLAVFTFDNDSDEVKVNWYSTRYDAFYREKNQLDITVPHTHVHEYVMEEKQATCTEDGGQFYTCTICGHSYVEAVVPAGHDYKDVVTEPTCAENGYTTHTCSRCGDIYTDAETEALGHKEVIDEAVDATCTETGLTEGRHCERCGEVLAAQTVTDKLGHDYEAVVTEPTCEDAGYTTYTCVRGDHTYVADETEALGHKEVIDEAVDATCTETGLTEGMHCERCGEVLAAQKVTDKLGHDYAEVVVDPTCTESGYTKHTCTRCDDVYEDAYVTELGHHFGEWFVSVESTYETAGEERRDCERCDAFETRELPVKQHSYTSVVVDPTCTEAGYTLYTCTECGNSYQDNAVKALGHSYGSWTIVVDATHDAKGTERRDCVRCDEFETREIAVKEHVYSSTVIAPTCTTEGYTVHTCECGDSYKDTYVSTLSHNFGEFSDVIEADCFNGGTKVHVCETCGFEELVQVEPLGHKLNAEVTAPSCTEAGYTTYTCQRCGYSYTDDATEPAGHDFGEWIVVIEADCVNRGMEMSDCQVCEHYETRYSDALGHDYESVVTAPDCRNEGYTTHTCTRCSDSYVDSYVESSDHGYGQWLTVTEATCTTEGLEKRICTGCGREETRTIEINDNHKEVVDEAVDASCTESGLTEGSHCERCGEVLVEQTSIDKLGHDYESVVTEATCTEKGYTTHTCTRCSDSYVDQYTDKAEHDYGLWFVEVEPTLTTQGVERRDCENCEHFERRILPATQHEYTAEVIAPTCTDVGYTVYTCAKCNDTYRDHIVDALGHELDQWVVIEEGECTKTGIERRDCVRCDHYEIRSTEAPGHDNKETVIEPTCTQMGYTIYECQNCKAKYEGDYVEALGHTFGEWYILGNSTCGEKGAERRDCEICDGFETREAAVLEHTYEEVVVDATCTEAGKIIYTCSRCNDTYTEQKSEPAGHSFGEWKVKSEATCTQDGTETRICEICDETEERTLKAKGHKYVDKGTAATCTENGVKKEVCERCSDAKEEVTVQKLGHSLAKKTATATCTQGGYELTYCQRCDYSKKTNETSALGHSFGPYVSDNNATADKDGTKTSKCTTCGSKDTVIEPGTMKVISNYMLNLDDDALTVEMNGSIDRSKLHLIVNYTDGTSEEITDYELSDLDASAAGKQDVSITYRDYSDVLEINVIEADDAEDTPESPSDNSSSDTGEPPVWAAIPLLGGLLGIVLLVAKKLFLKK